jgi:hypothetical protein
MSRPSAVALEIPALPFEKATAARSGMAGGAPLFAAEIAPDGLADFYRRAPSYLEDPGLPQQRRREVASRQPN